MINLDEMEAKLAAALTEAVGRSSAATFHARLPVPAPAPASEPAPSRRRQRGAAAPSRTPAAPAPGPFPTAQVAGPSSASELLELGRLEEADAAVAATAHPRDALSWTTMRALLSGDRDAACTGVEDLRRLAQRTDDTEAWTTYWMQRFWAAFEWGTEDERYGVLDHCRDRAYRFDDIQWWGNLALLLAAMGKTDEAVRAFDGALQLVTVATTDAIRTDVVTNLIEAAVLVGDPGRVASAGRHLRGAAVRLVVVGQGAVCKGSVERYLGLSYAAIGQRAQAGECFRRAEATHRSLGAGPLVTRTVQQASGALVAA